MPYIASLDGCWAKVERAKEHKDSLDRYIRELAAVESNCPRVGVKFDAQSSEQIFYISFMPDWTIHLRRASIILGDIVHNLRSVLDHLAFQLALWNTNGNVKNERGFSFLSATVHTKGKGGWPDKVKAHLSKVHPDHVAISAKLRDLSDLDKHRLLPTVVIPATSLKFFDMTTMMMFSMGHISQSIATGMSTTRIAAAQPAKLGAVVSRLPSPYLPERSSEEL